VSFWPPSWYELRTKSTSVASQRKCTFSHPTFSMSDAVAHMLRTQRSTGKQARARRAQRACRRRGHHTGMPLSTRALLRACAQRGRIRSGWRRLLLLSSPDAPRVARIRSADDALVPLPAYRTGGSSAAEGRRLVSQASRIQIIQQRPTCQAFCPVISQKSPCGPHERGLCSPPDSRSCAHTRCVPSWLHLN
jgi:hypothetical protein